MPLTYTPTFKKFKEEELDVLQKDADGPLNSFVIDEEAKKEYLEIAVNSGSISEQDYADCPIFRVEERKQSRYNLKRGYEILKLLQNVADNNKPADIMQENLLQNFHNEVTMAALVESCRKLHDQNTPNNQREFLLQCLDDAQEELYSIPDNITSQEIIALFNRSVELMDIENINSEIRKYITDFYSDYPFMTIAELSDVPANPISKEKINAFHITLHKRYDSVFNEIKSIYLDSLNNEILPDVVNSYLAIRGLQSIDTDTGVISGWVCVYDENCNGFRVKPKERKILCGKRTVEITWKRFEELMMHEVEIHVVRAENGYKLGSLELATGLPGTSDAEEGTGLIMEQLWSGEVKNTLGRDHFRYLGIAYAFGVVDGFKHDKDEVFDFLSRFMSITSITKSYSEDFDIASIIKKQRKLCFEHVFRMFRGMPKERVFLKDLGYYIGKQKLIKLITETDESPEKVIDYLQQGKFDPLNPIHQSVLRMLGLRGSLDD